MHKGDDFMDFFGTRIFQLGCFFAVISLFRETVCNKMSLLAYRHTRFSWKLNKRTHRSHERMKLKSLCVCMVRTWAFVCVCVCMCKDGRDCVICSLLFTINRSQSLSTGKLIKITCRDQQWPSAARV